MPGNRPSARDQSIDGGRVSGARHRQRPSPPGPSRASQSGKSPSRQPAGHRAKVTEAAASRALTSAALTAAATRSSSSSCVGIGDQLGIDPHRDDLQPTVDFDRDCAAAGRSFHLELPQRLERFLERLAQLAGVTHQIRQHSQLIEHGLAFLRSVRVWANFRRTTRGATAPAVYVAADSVGSSYSNRCGRASKSSTTR